MGGDEAQFVRVARRSGPSISLTFEGLPIAATQGDSVLAALLASRSWLRRLEWDGETRAGFCLMGACQDCWVWSAAGGRIRACTTLVAEGMELFAGPPLAAAPHG